jgi:hypothetical protein
MPKTRAKKIKSQSELSRQTAAPADGWLKRLLPFALFLWPFIYLYPMVVAINGSYKSIDNDFPYYYKFKLYLLANLANFHLPLWSPSEAAGYPFASSPFAQAFYPLNIPLVIFYWLANGYGWLDHQVFTVLGAAIFALGLFMWLRLLNSNLRAVIFATLIMSVSFKVTEILRFTTAIHTAAWYPWILYAVTRIMLSKSVRESVIAGAGLVFFVFCQCTAGYPYYFYYDQFLFIPYLLVFLIKPLRIRLLGEQSIDFKRAVTALAIAGAVALAVCSPYLLALKNLMSQTADRGGKSFAFSVSHVFSYQDTIGSLVYPPAAQAEGWYFFGITALLIMLLSLFGRTKTAADNKKISPENEIQPQYFSDYWGRLCFLLWFGVISYITYGAASYLFKFLWNYWPGFSGLRVWGRLNIILVPILAWFLSLAYASYESLLSSESIDTTSKNWRRWIPIAAVVLCYSAILCVQLYLFNKKIFTSQWLTYFSNVASSDILFIFYGAAAFAVVIFFLIISRWIPFKTSAALTTALAAMAAVNVLEIRHVGTNMWVYPTPSQDTERSRLNVAKIDEASFSYPRVENRGMITLTPAFNVGIIENWYFSRYISFLKNTQNELGARDILLGMKDGRRIFFSKSIDHPTVEAFLKDSSQYPRYGRLISYTGDELLWEIDAPVDGYLSFIDNWYTGWQVFVDDKPAEIKRLFGTFKSVHLPAGIHTVRFSYCPGIF